MGSCSSWLQLLSIMVPFLLLPTALLLLSAPPRTHNQATVDHRLLPRRSPETASRAAAAPSMKRQRNRTPENEVEAELSRARAAIRRAAGGRGNAAGVFSLPSVYRSAAAFYHLETLASYVKALP